MIDDFLISPIDLKINQDWTALVAMGTKIASTPPIESNIIPDRPGGNTINFQIGRTCKVSRHKYSEDWCLLYGEWGLKYLPWLPKMLDDMKEIDPVWALSIANGSCGEHVDWEEVPSAINYPINTSGAVTFVKYEDQEYSYPSISDQPWLLNTQYPHGIRSTELRLAFSLRFSVDYKIVRSWFNKNPGLVYGNK